MLDALMRMLQGGDGARSTSRMAMLAVAVVVFAAVVWGITHWATTPTYVPLYQNLDLHTAGQMADNLKKAGIQYQLADGGTALQVPVEDLARARVALAKDGLPLNGRPGLELFDKPSWGMTDFTQRVTYQRALEGELQRTISNMQGIARAEVHLVLPTESPLRRLETQASASVVLTLQKGAELPSDAVEGITALVSNSIEQLPPDHVAVMDDSGRLLSSLAGGSTEGLSTRQIELQRSVEHDLAQKIEDMLATAIGPGHARAQVAAQLSFDQVEKSTETYDPNGQVLQVEQKATGEPIPQGDSLAALQTVVANTYQNSHSVEKSTTATGQISKLTVAVLLDQKALKAGGPAIADAQTAELQQLVANAVGLDSTRGDRVSMLAVAFDTTKVASVAPKKAAIDLVDAGTRFSRPLVSIVAILVAAFVALKVLRPAPSSAPAAGGVPVLSVIEGGAADDAAAGSAPSIANAALQAQSAAALAALTGSGEVPQQVFAGTGKPIAEIHGLQQQPQVTAQVLRAWLAEGSN